MATTREVLTGLRAGAISRGRVEDALAAVLNVHNGSIMETSGMMCDPTVTVKCASDGQDWPCPTVQAIFEALGMAES